MVDRPGHAIWADLLKGRCTQVLRRRRLDDVSALLARKNVVAGGRGLSNKMTVGTSDQAAVLSSSVP